MNCLRCEGFGTILRYVDVSDRDGTWSEQAEVECPVCSTKPVSFNDLSAADWQEWVRNETEQYLNYHR